MACQHQKTEIILAGEGAMLRQCRFCHLIFADEEKHSDPEEAYKNYYKAQSGGRFDFGIEYIVKAFRLFRAVKIFLASPDAKSILDIGSGRGWMLYFLKKYFRYEIAAGTQISLNAYEFSKEKLGLEIYNKDLLELDFPKRFDIITLWHVLEHVPDPESYIAKTHQLLVDGGKILIEVPNFNSWTRIMTKKHWLALDLAHHRTFFTPDSLKRLLTVNNFKVKSVRTFSLEYSAFTSAQSFINLITGSDDYFFNWLQKGGFSAKVILHIIAFAVFFPACLLVNLGLYFSVSGEVIHIVAQKQ